jgi:hypothetical protein
MVTSFSPAQNAQREVVEAFVVSRSTLGAALGTEFVAARDEVR